jgi:hypothetical protein
LSKPTECTTQSINSNVKCGLQLIIYKYWLISYNKCIIPTQDVNNILFPVNNRKTVRAEKRRWEIID